MPDIVIINLANITKIQDEKSFDLLDLRYSIVDTPNKIQSFVNLDEIAPLGLELYKKFIQEMVNEKPILGVKINNFSIYWITDCAIKGYAWHWGRDFFLLLQLLQSNQNQLEKNYKAVIINLPEKWSFLKATIDNLVEKLYYSTNVTVVLINEGIRSRSLFKDFFLINKSWISNVIKFRKVNSIESKLPANIYLKHEISEGQNNLFNSVQELFKMNGQNIESLPYYWRNNPKIPRDFYNERPNLWQLFQILIKANLAFFKTLLLPDTQLNISTNINISSNFIKREIINTLLSNMHLFFFHEWLSSYFSKLRNKLVVYYADEFYGVGRIVSHAAAPFEKLKTRGLQHGHFMESHTVYLITDTELIAGIPKPDTFITWGKYYSHLFGKNNKLGVSHVAPLGNPNYVLSDDKKEYPAVIKKVLWCLTSKECMQVEWALIREGLQVFDVDVEIRMHPTPHIKKEEVVELIGNDIQYCFSKKNTINEAINSNDLVLVSAHSTTFLDAYINKRNCIRIISRFWEGKNQISSYHIKTVFSAKDFHVAITQFLNQPLSDKVDVNEIEMLRNNWSNFLNLENNE
jgi:hypothetical protein